MAILRDWKWGVTAAADIIIIITGATTFHLVTYSIKGWLYKTGGAFASEKQVCLCIRE